MMRRRGWVVGAALSLAVAGCSTGQAPEVHRFTLLPPPPAAAFPQNMQIQMGSVNGVAPFRDTGIAHQSDPYRLDNYKFSRWVAPPTEMVAETLDHLARQEVGASQTADPEELPLVLDARIDAFQQVQEGARSSVLVEVDFCLNQRETGRAQWCKTLRRSMQAFNDSPDAAAQAIDNCFNQVLVDLASELSRQAAIPRPKRAPSDLAPGPQHHRKPFLGR